MDCVNARVRKLLADVLELPREERVELVRDVLTTLGDEERDAAAAWGELVRQRADDVLAGRNLGPEARPFLAELRERLRREG